MTVNATIDRPQHAAHSGYSAGESEEGEELQARPTPPRSSLLLESGSEGIAAAA